MKKWHEYSNYRKLKNPDGSYTYIITINGEDVEVSEAVYADYSAMSRKMKYMELDLKHDRVKKDGNSKPVLDANGQPVILPELEMSLDKLVDDDWEFRSSEPSPEDIYITAEFSESDELRRCIALLDEDEQALINALFHKDMTEQQYAEMLGVTQQAVHKRKNRILKKIKNFWG